MNYNHHWNDYPEHFQMPGNNGFTGIPYVPIRQEQGAVSSTKTGHWTTKQNAKYYAFLIRFKEKFSQKQTRRHWKVFKSLAQFIQTRDANQCRSHHHKMKKNHGSIDQTIEFLRKKQPGLEKKSEKYLDQLQNVDFNAFGQKSNKTIYNLNQAPQPEEPINWDLQPLPRIDLNFGNRFSILSGEKPKDITNKKTNDGYQEVEIFPQEKMEEFLPDFNQAPEIFDTNFRGFPSTGMIGSSNIPEQLQFPNNDLQFLSAPGYQMERRSQERKNKIIQCQYYFTKWITSVGELINEENNSFQEPRD